MKNRDYWFSKAFVAELLKQLPQHVFWKDVGGVYLGCNNVFAESLGLSSPEEIVGKTDYDLPTLKEQSEAYRADDAEVMTTKKSKLNIEETQTLPDGQERTLLTSKVPLFDDNGNVIGVLGIYSDITELREAKELAEAANKAKSAFVANISHDLRNAEGGKILLSQAMMEDPAQRTYENAKMIYDSSTTLLNMMNNVLDFMRIENPDFHKLSKDERFSISGIMNDIKALYTVSMHTKNLKFIVDIDKDMPIYLISKPFLINKILMNLIGNALKFTEEGSVTVSVSLSGEKNNPTLLMSVADTGIGIPEDKRQKVFEWFERLTPTYKGTYEGAGMGLAITKESIDALKGTITIENNHPQGTVFILQIPVQIAEDIKDTESVETYITEDDIRKSNQTPSHYQHKTQAHIEKGEEKIPIMMDNHSKKILLIEDIPMAAKAATISLEKLGYSVDWADTGEKGLVMILTGQYDLVLSDIGLPGISGEDVVKQARAAYVRIPMYALTGHADLDEQLLRAGFNGVLVKPLSLNKFKEFIQIQDEKHEAAQHPVDSDEVIDFNYGVAIEYDRETIIDLLNGLIEVIPEMLSNLKSAINENNIMKIRDTLHALRGGACYAPTPELNQVLKVAHDKVKDLTEDEINTEILNTIFSESFAAIDRLLEEFKKQGY